MWQTDPGNRGSQQGMRWGVRRTESGQQTLENSHRASQKGPERQGPSPAALSLNVGHRGPSICWLLVPMLAESTWLGGESAPQNMLDWMEMETIMLFGCSGGVGNGLQNSLMNLKFHGGER